jgi:hypothetical protein
MHCLQKKQLEITFRFEATLKASCPCKNFYPFFATLTFDQEHLPISSAGYPTIQRKKFTQFLRRYDMLCRLKYGKGMYPKLKFLASGEYGSIGQRPHYHVIPVLADPILFEKAWSIRGKPLGYVDIQTEFKTNAIGYTAKYIAKHENNQHNYKCVEPEFVTWSRGLGKEYLTSAMLNYFHADPANRNTLPLLDGAKMALPKFYADKIQFTEWDKYLQQKKAKEYREKSDKESLANYSHIPDERDRIYALHLDKLELNKRKIQKQKAALKMKQHQKLKTL